LLKQSRLGIREIVLKVSKIGVGVSFEPSVIGRDFDVRLGSNNKKLEEFGAFK
jgi:hypothetical protein